MAVRIKPCFGCPVAKSGNPECASLKATMKDRVSGLGLRTAIFDCPVLMASCTPGTRVVIPQKYMVDAPEVAWSGEYSETRVASADVPATILSVDATGFSAVVDKEAFERVVDEASEGSFRDKTLARFRRRMPFSRIKSFIPEPPRKVCAAGNTTHSDGSCDSASGCACMEIETLSIGASHV
jgi:hypothetical protein